MQLITDIDIAIVCLKSGGIVVYPTETSYGIGCDVTNEAAVARVFEIKKRPLEKGVTVLLSSNDPFGDFFLSWQPDLRDLATKHWPGPLNIVCPIEPTTSIAPRCFTDRTIAIRRSSHPIANALVDALGVPLVSTSANISGEPELYSAQEIYDRLSKESIQPDMIFDAGVLPKRAPSTLIVWDDARGVVVLRQGEIEV